MKAKDKKKIEVKIALLKEARTWIERFGSSSVTYGICGALWQARQKLYPGPPYANYLNGKPTEAHIAIICRDDLESYIGNSLGKGNVYLYDWLRKNGFMDEASSAEKVRDARLQWIDWMVNEYEKKLAKEAA